MCLFIVLKVVHVAAEVYVHAEAFYDEHRIELRRSASVRSFAPASREVALDDDRCIPFDRLLIATGSRPRKLDYHGELMTRSIPGPPSGRRGRRIVLA